MGLEVGGPASGLEATRKARSRGPAYAKLLRQTNIAPDLCRKGNCPFTVVIISVPKISLESISLDEMGGLSYQEDPYRY